MPKGCIIYCIEKGILELNTLLSIASIRMFGGDMNHFDIYCLQPRKEFPISNKTKKKLDEFGVNFMDEPLNTVHRYYGLANKPFACEYMMENYSYDQYLFLDGDTLIVNDPVKNLSIFNEINLCPVNIKGIGIRDLDDVNNNYWLNLFKKADVDLENLPMIETVISKEKIIGYWNSGVILFNGQSSICRDWSKLLDVVLSKRSYREIGIFFTEQSCLSAVLLNGKYSPGRLSSVCNFPLVKRKELPLKYIEDISIIHHYGNLRLLRNYEGDLIDQRKIQWILQQIDKLGIIPSNILHRLIEAGIQSKMNLMEKLYFFIYKFSAN